MKTLDQLEQAESALWKIFNITERTRDSKSILEIKNIVAEYLEKKINKKTEERGEK